MNHYIEVDETDDGKQWLVVHTGSRNLGFMVADYHQKKAKDNAKDKDEYIPKNLEYLEGTDMLEYLDDMRLMNYYAELNRLFILQRLTEEDFEDIEANMITSIHNYYHHDDQIIRKGAIKAYKNEPLLIPLNMRDGIVIGKGRGIHDWNYSAPHGAGRVMSRRQAKDELDINDFQEQMKGIWTSCISQSTLDEAPDAYKSAEMIIDVIDQSVIIDEIAKPVYNFKA